MALTWRYLRSGATGDPAILPECGNISSIISRNAPSIMVTKAVSDTID
jgi:hypothetical protein